MSRRPASFDLSLTWAQRGDTFSLGENIKGWSPHVQKYLDCKRELACCSRFGALRTLVRRIRNLQEQGWNSLEVHRSQTPLRGIEPFLVTLRFVPPSNISMHELLELSQGPLSDYFAIDQEAMMKFFGITF